jgi:hypothetical protein
LFGRFRYINQFIPHITNRGKLTLAQNWLSPKPFRFFLEPGLHDVLEESTQERYFACLQIQTGGEAAMQYKLPKVQMENSYPQVTLNGEDPENGMFGASQECLG